jgi:hypothetical protein
MFVLLPTFYYLLLTFFRSVPLHFCLCTFVFCLFYLLLTFFRPVPLYFCLCTFIFCLSTYYLLLTPYFFLSLCPLVSTYNFLKKMLIVTSRAASANKMGFVCFRRFILLNYNPYLSIFNSLLHFVWSDFFTIKIVQSFLINTDGLTSRCDTCNATVNNSGDTSAYYCWSTYSYARAHT